MVQLTKIIAATRPPFLILAPICVFLGTSVAKYSGFQISTLHFCLAILGAITAAIAVNTLNEYQDFHSGLDAITTKTPFSGGSGLLINTLELAPQVLKLSISAMIVTLLIGGYFLSFVNPILFFIGLLGLLIIITYTKWLNRSPLLCLISPGLCFGVLMVAGSFLIQSNELNIFVFHVALLPFFLINNLLLINQFPDIDADEKIGRNHLPIKCGTKVASFIFAGFNLCALVVTFYLSFKQLIPTLSLVCILPILMNLFSVPALIKLGKHINQNPKVLVLNVISANLTPLILGGILWFS